MGDFGEGSYGWSWEENKQFEMALAVVDEDDPDRWGVVASMVGGNKSAEDVRKHYVILLEDLQRIESGKLDHALVGEESESLLQVDCAQPCSWTEEDHKIVDPVETEMLTISSLIRTSTVITGCCYK